MEEIENISWREFVVLVKGLSPHSALVSKLSNREKIIEDDAGVERFFEDQLRVGT